MGVDDAVPEPLTQGEKLQRLTRVRQVRAYYDAGVTAASNMIRLCRDAIVEQTMASVEPNQVLDAGVVIRRALDAAAKAARRASFDPKDWEQIASATFEEDVELAKKWLGTATAQSVLSKPPPKEKP